MSDFYKNKSFGRINFTEPVIISGRCFGLKPMSVYDFMICNKMLDKLYDDLTSQGLTESFFYNICEQACVISMCLRDIKNNKVFENGLEVLKGLTPNELKFLYGEYSKLLNKISDRDSDTDKILNHAKQGAKQTKNFKNSEKVISKVKEIINA